MQIHHADDLWAGLRKWCHRWRAYFDTATVAFLALVVGLTLGELSSEGLDVVASVFGLIALASVCLFGGMALWRIHEERRSTNRRWVWLVLGLMVAATVSYQLDGVAPPIVAILYHSSVIVSAIYLAAAVRGRRKHWR